MADDTVLVVGSDANWRDCASMDDHTFGQALTPTPGNSAAIYNFRRVPLSLWERWEKARTEYRDAMYAMNIAPRVDPLSVRQGIMTATTIDTP